jgi:alpha-glucan,water dikinase
VGLIDSLHAAMQEEGLPLPRGHERVWACIRSVWASKWTDRAWLSREKQGIPHGEVYMAVLIQQVVEAEYAFVIHTVNPLSGAPAEVYGEVVPGLGETLTSSYPGSALGFTCSKKALEPRIETLPSKPVGLHGGGFIFRSDSSAEDLPGYAGAGLYESVTLDPPRRLAIDYRNLALLREEPFRRGALVALTRIAIDIEESLGSPQDIEGVFSRGGPYCVVQSRPQVGVSHG